MPILTRQRLLCVKAEGTLGTPEALDATMGAMNIQEMSRNPATPFTPILAQSGVGRRGGVAGARMGTFECMTYMHGKGASGLPGWADLLKGCGGTFSTQTFAPVANNGVGLTLGMFRGSSTTAKIYQMAGAMGNAVMSFKAGEIVPIRFTFSGKIYGATTQTLPTPTFPTVTPPRFVGATFTIGGTTYQISDLEFDLGNVVVMRPDPTDSSNSGYISAWIADRIPKVRIAPESLPLASKDWDDAFHSGTQAALSLVLGSAANNTITITAPKMQLAAPPQDGDREGILTEQLQFELKQNGDTVDSEYSIAFS